MGMSGRKGRPADPPARSRDSQGSPMAIVAIALAGGIGYIAWNFWKRWQEEKNVPKDAGGTAGSPEETKGNSKGSTFTFGKQLPKSAASTSTSGRPSSGTTATRHPPSRQDAKPKSQKQLRKDAKQAKKAAREQATAEGAALSAAIAKRAKELGMGAQPPPEPQKQHYVDYEGVEKAYDKIVEWQQSGKKKF